MKHFISQADQPILITPFTSEQLKTWLASQDQHTQHIVAMNNFEAKAASYCLLPDVDGKLKQVLLGVASDDDFWSVGALPMQLPQGNYALDTDKQLFHRALAWGLACYQFDRYKKATEIHAKLLLPESIDQQSLQDQLDAIYLARDLINTPPEDMNPETLAAEVKLIAKQHKAKIKIIVGDDLLKKNYPAIHAVGRAADKAPRLIDLKWGDATHKKITLVGKGVCFDTGGLDLKNAAGMLTMKKDMGGSAHAIALAQLIMAQKLPVCLRLLVPAVENAINERAYRPSDVIDTRAGKTVEIQNTDAEGRVILCDALYEACEDKPDLLIDFTTLTGAARVALGTDVPAMFSNTQSVADALVDQSNKQQDPLWQMPLYQPYLELLESKIADISNCALGGYGGAITAALYLQQFVSDDVPWVHFDMMAANVKAKPARPEGGEATALRAVYAYIKSIL